MGGNNPLTYISSHLITPLGSLFQTAIVMQTGITESCYVLKQSGRGWRGRGVLVSYWGLPGKCYQGSPCVTMATASPHPPLACAPSLRIGRLPPAYKKRDQLAKLEYQAARYINDTSGRKPQCYFFAHSHPILSLEVLDRSDSLPPAQGLLGQQSHIE